jgi:hypothetical protein
MQIPCVYLPGPAPAVSVANTNLTIVCIGDCIGQYRTYSATDTELMIVKANV